MQKVFSEKLDIKLIQHVRQHPVLYDYNDPKYMDFNAREVAWQKIGDSLEKPAADCKVRWINIRDVHRRIIRKSITGCSRQKRAYKYANHLEFMKSYYKEVVTADPEQESEEETDKASAADTSSWNNMGDDGVEDNIYIEYDNSSNEEDSQPLKKRKKSNKTVKNNNFEEVEVPVQSINDKPEFDVADPVDAFLISIGATLKRFSPYHLNLAKSKIFHIVQEHDLQQIVERQPNRTDSSNISTETPVFYQG